MASSIGISKVEWTRVLERLSPQVRKGVMDLRSRHEDLRRLIAETQAAIPTLDFDHYRARLQNDSEYDGLVRESEQRLAAFSPAKIDLTAKLGELEAQREAKVAPGVVMTKCADERGRRLSEQAGGRCE